jgi:phosphate transport system substrate-binding protein
MSRARRNSVLLSGQKHAKAISFHITQKNIPNLTEAYGEGDIRSGGGRTNMENVMLKKLFASALLTLVAGSGFLVSQACAETLTIQGSTTVANAVMVTQKAAVEAASGVKYEIIANGSSQGMLSVAEGKAVLGMISAELDVEIAKVKAKYPGKLDGKDLREHRIGVSAVAFAVNPNNPVKSLKLEQLAAILKGEIKDWSEVGGTKAPIIVIAEKKGGGIRSMVESKLLNKGEIEATLREVPSAPQANKIVAQLPNAIALTSTSSITDQVVALKTDNVIAQPLNLITLGDPTKEAAKIIEAAKTVLNKGSGS